MYLDVPRPPRCPDVTLVTEYKKQTRLVADRDKPRGLGTSFMAHKPRGQIPLSLFGFNSGLAFDWDLASGLSIQVNISILSAYSLLFKDILNKENNMSSYFSVKL